MQRPMFVRMPMGRVAVLSLPPMYAWPAPIKRLIFGVGIALCISAYTAMAAGIIGLMTLVIELM